MERRISATITTKVGDVERTHSASVEFDWQTRWQDALADLFGQLRQEEGKPVPEWKTAGDDTGGPPA